MCFQLTERKNGNFVVNERKIHTTLTLTGNWTLVHYQLSWNSNWKTESNDENFFYKTGSHTQNGLTFNAFPVVICTCFNKLPAVINASPDKLHATPWRSRPAYGILRSADYKTTQFIPSCGWSDKTTVASILSGYSRLCTLRAIGLAVKMPKMSNTVGVQIDERQLPDQSTLTGRPK